MNGFHNIKRGSIWRSNKGFSEDILVIVTESYTFPENVVYRYLAGPCKDDGVYTRSPQSFMSLFRFTNRHDYSLTLNENSLKDCNLML